MMWIWIILAIGLLGMISIIAWAIWLAHKASDVFAEMAMLGRRGEEFADLLSQVGVHSERTVDSQVKRHSVV